MTTRLIHGPICGDTGQAGQFYDRLPTPQALSNRSSDVVPRSCVTQPETQRHQTCERQPSRVVASRDGKCSAVDDRYENSGNGDPTRDGMAAVKPPLEHEIPNGRIVKSC
jgi:hypothetical protein